MFWAGQHALRHILFRDTQMDILSLNYMVCEGMYTGYAVQHTVYMGLSM